MVIFEHGKTYNEEEKYPFRICPECMSEKTEIVMKSVGGHRTGNHYYHVHGFTERKLVYVNYKCNECGCVFEDEYEESRKQREISINTALFIIGILILAISIFLLCCFLKIDDYSWFDVLGLMASAIGILVGSCLVPVSLID